MANRNLLWIGLSVMALSLSCGEAENPMGEGLVDTGLSSESDTLIVCPVTEAVSFQFICPSADEECDRGPGSSPMLVLGAGYGYRAVMALSFESVGVNTGVVVDSAWVRLTAARDPAGAPVDLTVHALVDTLVESSLFYGDSLAYDPTPLPAVFTWSGRRLRIDLTETVAGWRTTASKRGLVVASHDPGPSFAVFHSSESGTRVDTSTVRPVVFIYQHPEGGSTTAFSYALAGNDSYMLWWDPSADSLSVPEDRLTIGKGFVTRSLLRVDVSSIPTRATINRARLVLHVDPTESVFDTLQAVAHLVDGEWAGSATEFQSAVLAVGWVFPGVDSAVVNVTGLVQKWTAGMDENDGFLLKCYGETDNIDFVRFFGLSGSGAPAPVLTVEYSLPPPPWFHE